MIIGSIANCTREMAAFHPLLQRYIKYLRDTDFSKLPPGQYELDGDKVFMIVQQYRTEPRNIKKAESHERYLDIQYVASGEESMGYALASDTNQVSEDLLQEKDIVFYSQVDNETFLTILPGMYVVLFPWDIHRPACSSGQPSLVTKVVIKIRASEICTT